jgi:hypothetical protein
MNGEAPMEPERRGTPDENVDEASRESFPASDPPAFNPTHVGEPDRHLPPPAPPPEDAGEQPGAAAP